jgi:hypothetical protein
MKARLVGSLEYLVKPFPIEILRQLAKTYIKPITPENAEGATL